MTLLQPPSHAGQLRVSSLLLASALSRAGDDALLADGVRVVADMAARVAAGELDAETAAAEILRGIERRAPRIVVGKDARNAAFIQRLMPSGYWRAILRLSGGKV